MKVGYSTLRLDSWFNPTWHTNDSPNQVCPGARFPQPGAPFLLIPRFVGVGRTSWFLSHPWQMFSQPELQPISRMLAEPGVSDVVVNGLVARDDLEIIVTQLDADSATHIRLALQIVSDTRT